jgi:Arylsulfatase A and related enzymes
MPDRFAEIFESPNAATTIFKKSLGFILNEKSPFFIWIHIMPPHDPYYTSGKFQYSVLNEKIFISPRHFVDYMNKNKEAYPPDRQNMVDKMRLRYDENIMYADYEFGSFLKVLSGTGIYEHSILIVSSDHGESFRKGYIAHGGIRLENLYQQFIRIPLIIHTPKQRICKRIKSNAEHVDLAPTILDLLNLAVPKWMEGESLKGAIYDNKITMRPKYSMTFSPIRVNKPIPNGAIAVIEGDYKYIFQTEDNRGELYNIKNDPWENRNLVNTERRIADELKHLVTKKLP